jgi:hypothetical protein
MTVITFAFALALGLGCGGGGSLKKSGETCVGSSECDVGLICDLARTPGVCANMGSIDGAIPADAARIDAKPRDAAPAVDAAVDAPPVDAPDDAAIDAI